MLQIRYSLPLLLLLIFFLLVAFSDLFSSRIFLSYEKNPLFIDFHKNFTKYWDIFNYSIYNRDNNNKKKLCDSIKKKRID